MRPSSIPHNWVMVTGAMRSGTTFVGRVLATGHRRAYVHEPFNTQCGLPDLPVRYLVDDSAIGRSYHLDEALDSITSLQCQLGDGIFKQDVGWRRRGKQLAGGRGQLNLRFARLHPALQSGVIKDPMGALVAPTLHRDHGVAIVVMVRHPVAWHASVAHHGFKLNGAIESFLRQAESSPGLMTSDEMSLATTGDYLERSSVVWNVIYRRLHRELSGQVGAMFVRHEDLSGDPIATFRQIGSAVDLPLTRNAVRRIEKSTSSSNSVEASHDRSHDFQRDSRKLFEHRVTSVRAQDRERLAELCGPVGAHWYDSRSFTDGILNPAKAW